MVDSRKSSLQIAPTKPFEFDFSLRFIRGFAPCASDHYCGQRQLVTGGYTDELPFIARVEPTDGSERLELDVDWLETQGNPDEVGLWIRRFLSLEDDLKPLYQAAEDDPPFKRVVDDLYGYHHVRFPSPFEAACWAALSQRTPMAVSKKLKHDLVAVAGETRRIEKVEISLFPTPERVLAHRRAVEKTIAHQQKVKTLMSAAEAFLSHDLYALDDEEIENVLRGVWGFGEWSSEFILLRGFGRLNRIPASERRLREAVARRYSLGKPEAAKDDLHRLGKRYGRKGGYWAHYIRVWTHFQDQSGMDPA
jgi:DNA-3-methyladenine glycosylase II